MADDLFPAVATRAVSVIRVLAQAGFTDQEIADQLGLDVGAVRASGELAGTVGQAHDERVERALYEAAVGARAWTERLDSMGAVHKLEAQLPPDVRAAQTWLERRQGERWGPNAAPPIPVVVVRLQAPGPAQGGQVIEGEAVTAARGRGLRRQAGGVD